MIRRFAAILAAGFALAAHAQTQEINFGIIATEKSGALKQMWEPFLEDMSKRTGLKVTGFYATDYTGVIEAQRFGKVHIAWYGNKSAIDAVDRANGEVFVQFIDLNGTPGYYSYLITHRDSPIKTLDDMFRMGKDLSFGAGDPQSTSGTLVPGYYVFTQRGTDPKDVFKAVRPASHGVNLLAVLNKQVDVATNNSEEIDKLKDPAKAEQVRIIWTSPLIPRDPIVWRKDLPEDVKAKLKSFFIGYGKDAREKEILKNMQQIAGFRESSNAQLIPIRQLELAKNRKQIENNAALSAAEKEAKLREIDDKLMELSKLAKGS